MAPITPIPITIITGFLGSGKTTLLLHLLPQLRAQNPAYKLALLKNEFGDVAIDSQLASASSIAGVRELLNGCICCNLVGQLGDALRELAAGQEADRIVVETSGSAFPATLAMEVNRLARETAGRYVLDGVVTVIDVENWRGYEDTSYTARIQARYTDLVVFNKWELCDERQFDVCLDRLGDLEVQIAWVKSDRGRVLADLVFGIDGAMARGLEANGAGGGHAGHGPKHEHDIEHRSEVEVLSITLHAEDSAVVDTTKLERLLQSAPKDEVYRIKAVLAASSPLQSSDAGMAEVSMQSGRGRYILNWAFGRWTCTLMETTADEHESSSGLALRMTMILARYESSKWKKKLETAGLVALEGDQEGTLLVEKVA
jgi:G3E family GTPase